MASIADNLAVVEDAIAAACRKAGRPRGEVQLVAVSKTHPGELLLEAAAAGQRVFGENRVQEFAEKKEQLAARGYLVEGDAAGVSAAALRVHLIGHLQSNKAGKASELFSIIDTVDSLKLAERLHAGAASLNRVLPILLEIKLSDEASKEGLPPGSGELTRLLERLPDLPSVQLHGLMTIAPIEGGADTARTCFRRLRLLRDELSRQWPRLCFEELSMGMSGDFSEAIAEGSTQVRIGTAIFGARPRLR